ncbi:MAG: archaemetzincin family Zn-dependent metalloprotease [candidate division WOR-3 bacterium]|nr:archaemetzincin family Zn-dependent metalloprotease [candidate division WOR-3 bacterium]
MVCLYQQEGLEFSELIKDIIKKQFNLPVVVAHSVRIPSQAFNPLRTQYDAMKIIETFVYSLDQKCNWHLIIIDKDIYTPRFNFIFGLADVQRNIAVVSTYRLSKNGLLKERLAKEVVHEMGHILGLNHCPIPVCVMYFSNTVADTDRKGFDLCPECRRKVERI